MKILKSIFLSALLLGSTMMFSCSDDDDDNSCLVCDAFEDEDGFTSEAIDICVGDEDEDGNIVTQDVLDLARTFAVALGASCN